MNVKKIAVGICRFVVHAGRSSVAFLKTLISRKATEVSEICQICFSAG